MSEFNLNVRQTFDNLLKIYQDIAILFQDADALLEQAGYLCFHGNEMIVENSRSLGHPEWWFYQYMLRGYARADNAMDMKTIGVFFFNKRQKPVNPFILYGSYILASPSGERHRSKVVALREIWFKSNPEMTLDRRYPIGGSHGIDHGFVQGIALERVKDVNALRELVIESLLIP